MKSLRLECSVTSYRTGFLFKSLYGTGGVGIWQRQSVQVFVKVPEEPLQKVEQTSANNMLTTKTYRAEESKQTKYESHFTAQTIIRGVQGSIKPKHSRFMQVGNQMCLQNNESLCRHVLQSECCAKEQQYGFILLTFFVDVLAIHHSATSSW